VTACLMVWLMPMMVSFQALELDGDNRSPKDGRGVR
jgi:hypothetical protein